MTLTSPMNSREECLLGVGTKKTRSENGYKNYKHTLKDFGIKENRELGR